VPKYIPIIYFYFLKIIFDISTSKRSKKHKPHLILIKIIKIQLKINSTRAEQARPIKARDEDDCWCCAMVMMAPACVAFTTEKKWRIVAVIRERANAPLTIYKNDMTSHHGSSVHRHTHISCIHTKCWFYQLSQDFNWYFKVFFYLKLYFL